MASGAGSDTCRRRDLFHFSNLFCSSSSICFHFYNPLEHFKIYLLELTSNKAISAGDKERKRTPASPHISHPPCTGSIPQSAKEKHILSTQTIKVELHLTSYPGSSRSTILSGRYHEINHRAPQTDMAKLPSELPSITSEQATPSLPIWNTCPPPCRKRRSLENGKTLIERMVSSLVMGPLSDGPLFFQLRPINRIFSPTTPPIWPRYFLTFLSSPILLTLQYFVSMDRRLSSCLILTLKVWSRGYQSQTMVVRSYWPLSMEITSLQTLDPLLPPTRRRCDCGNRLDLVIHLNPTACTHQHLRCTSTTDRKLSPEEDTHWISLTAGDTLGPLLASCPVRLSRTHDNSFFWVDISFLEKFSRLEFMELSSSTSQCLLIRTIHHFSELIVNVVSTSLGLACDLVLLCSRLRALLDMLSNYLSFMSDFHNARIVVSSFTLGKTLNFVTFLPSD